MVFRLGGGADLDDLCQLVMEKMIRSLPTYREESSLGGWVRGICVHVTRDFLRARQVRSAVAADPEEGERAPAFDDPERDAATLEELRRCERALATLSADHRTVFVLKVVQGYSIDEVAELMGAANSTTRLRLYFARRAFQKAWARLQEGAP